MDFLFPGYPLPTSALGMCGLQKSPPISGLGMCGLHVMSPWRGSHSVFFQFLDFSDFRPKKSNVSLKSAVLPPHGLSHEDFIQGN